MVTPDGENEPRKPGRPRKTTPEPAPQRPPGPIQLEIRVNGKIMCLQPVHTYTIDQTSDPDKVTVTGVLRLP